MKGQWTEFPVLSWVSLGTSLSGSDGGVDIPCFGAEAEEAGSLGTGPGSTRNSHCLSRLHLLGCLCGSGNQEWGWRQGRAGQDRVSPAVPREPAEVPWFLHITQNSWY